MRLYWFVPNHLPIAPRPHRDELISSWLRRVAAANWLSVGDLLNAIRESDQDLPVLRDAEYCLPDPWRSRMATLARVPVERILAMELSLRFSHVESSWFSYHPALGPLQGTDARPALRSRSLSMNHYPSWIHRIPAMIEALAHSETDQIDRRMAEQLFDLRKTAAFRPCAALRR